MAVISILRKAGTVVIPVLTQNYISEATASADTKMNKNKVGQAK